MLRLTANSVGKRIQQTQINAGKRLFHNAQGYDSIVLGAYNGDSIRLTASKHVSGDTKQLIEEQLKASHFKKAGDVRTLYNVGGVKQVAIVGLGKEADIKDKQEAARKAVSHSSVFYTCILNQKKNQKLGCTWFACFKASRC